MASLLSNSGYKIPHWITVKMESWQDNKVLEMAKNGGILHPKAQYALEQYVQKGLLSLGNPLWITLYKISPRMIGFNEHTRSSDFFKKVFSLGFFETCWKVTVHACLSPDKIENIIFSSASQTQTRYCHSDVSLTIEPGFEGRKILNARLSDYSKSLINLDAEFIFERSRR